MKAHTAEVTAVTCAEGLLVSTGKDDMLSIFSAQGGEYEFLRQIPLETYHFASSMDLLGGKILVGHDNGIIQTVNIDGTDR